MGRQRDPAGPASLYAEMVGRKVADRLNADTNRTKREVLLEVLLIAIALEGNNGELRFPRRLIDQADDARLAGRRLESSFEVPAHEYVITLTRPAPTSPEQRTLDQTH